MWERVKREANGEWVGAVRDGNIVACRVPDDLPGFCQENIRALSERR